MEVEVVAAAVVPAPGPPPERTRLQSREPAIPAVTPAPTTTFSVTVR